jgi:uncharacterized protein YbaR (Trm112 family)
MAVYQACLALIKSHSRQFLYDTEAFAMAVRQDLLDILVCPLCKAPVKLVPDGSGLKCQVCKRVYPIRDDIPVMLPEEAKIATD